MLKRKFILKNNKPVTAIEFTKEMYDYLLYNISKNDKENPVPVTLSQFTEAKFLWNWFTKQVYIETNFGFEEVYVGDFIEVEYLDFHFKYKPNKREEFLNKYEEI
jgi:hypothetical protein